MPTRLAITLTLMAGFTTVQSVGAPDGDPLKDLTAVRRAWCS